MGGKEIYKQQTVGSEVGSELLAPVAATEFFCIQLLSILKLLRLEFSRRLLALSRNQRQFQEKSAIFSDCTKRKVSNIDRNGAVIEGEKKKKV